MPSLYPLSSPKGLSRAAEDAAIAVIRSGRYTMGRHVQQFEQDFAAWVGTKHAVMVNSGSSANLLAVEAMLRPSNGHPKWRVGDRVLVPALSWSTTIWPIVQLGLVPVFVDADPDTLAMNLDHADRLMTRNTVGMMLIHVMGLAADLRRYTAFCEAHKLTLIEDACEAFGAHYYQQSVGTAGLIGTFSHYFSHQLPTIEGGTLVTDDDEVADDLRSMRAHGWTRDRSDRREIEARLDIDPRFCFYSSGYNVRPTEIQGAIGVEHLRQADAMLKKRYATAIGLIDALKAVPWIEVVGANYVERAFAYRKDRRHSWMNLPCVVRPGAPMTAKAVMCRLQEAGIETRPILAGNITRHPALRQVVSFVQPMPVADRIMRDGFMIGCHPCGASTMKKIQSALRTLEAVAA